MNDTKDKPEILRMILEKLKGKRNTLDYKEINSGNNSGESPLHIVMKSRATNNLYGVEKSQRANSRFSRPVGKDEDEDEDKYADVSLECAEILIKHDADLYAKNDSNQTPFDLIDPNDTEMLDIVKQFNPDKMPKKPEEPPVPKIRDKSNSIAGGYATVSMQMRKAFYAMQEKKEQIKKEKQLKKKKSILDKNIFAEPQKMEPKKVEEKNKEGLPDHIKELFTKPDNTTGRSLYEIFGLVDVVEEDISKPLPFSNKTDSANTNINIPPPPPLPGEPVTSTSIRDEHTPLPLPSKTDSANTNINIPPPPPLPGEPVTSTSIRDEYTPLPLPEKLIIPKSKDNKQLSIKNDTSKTASKLPKSNEPPKKKAPPPPTIQDASKIPHKLPPRSTSTKKQGPPPTPPKPKKFMIKPGLKPLTKPHVKKAGSKDDSVIRGRNETPPTMKTSDIIKLMENTGGTSLLFKGGEIDKKDKAPRTPKRKNVKALKIKKRATIKSDTFDEKSNDSTGNIGSSGQVGTSGSSVNVAALRDKLFGGESSKVLGTIKTREKEKDGKQTDVMTHKEESKDIKPGKGKESITDGKHLMYNVHNNPDNSDDEFDIDALDINALTSTLKNAGVKLN